MKRPDFSDSQAWPTDRLRHLLSDIDAEIERRKQPPEPVDLDQIEKRLMREAESFQRRRDVVRTPR